MCVQVTPLAPVLVGEPPPDLHVGSQEMSVQLRCDAFDLWVFRRDQDEVRYLVLHTSQEKADRWFNGGRFWQIPGEYVGENESIEAAAQRSVETLGLNLDSVWAVEHTYVIACPHHLNGQGSGDMPRDGLCMSCASAGADRRSRRNPVCIWNDHDLRRALMGRPLPPAPARSAATTAFPTAGAQRWSEADPRLPR